MAKVEWTKGANRARIAILAYGSDMFGLKASQQLNDRIEDYADCLGKTPFMGIIEPLLAERRIEYRSLVIHKHYKLIYRVENDKVYIADLWDTRCEPARLTRRMRGK